MKQLNWNGKDVLLVEVPEGGKGVLIEPNNGRLWIRTFDITGGTINVKLLKHGNWQLAFASPLSPTEEEAREFVGRTYHGLETLYINYMTNQRWYILKDVIKSLKSRIRSEGFEQPERVVILTKTQTNG